MMCLMLVTLAGCAGQQDAGSSGDQQQAAGQEDQQQAAEEQISYEDAKVSYLGPKGTYTEEACQHFFGKQGDHPGDHT